MRKLILVLFLLSACGDKNTVVVQQCTTTETEQGVVITCPDGTTTTIGNTQEAAPTDSESSDPIVVPATPLCVEVKCRGNKADVITGC